MGWLPIHKQAESVSTCCPFKADSCGPLVDGWRYQKVLLNGVPCFEPNGAWSIITDVTGMRVERSSCGGFKWAECVAGAVGMILSQSSPSFLMNLRLSKRLMNREHPQAYLTRWPVMTAIHVGYCNLSDWYGNMFSAINIFQNCLPSFIFYNQNSYMLNMTETNQIFLHESSGTGTFQHCCCDGATPSVSKVETAPPPIQ